MNGLEQLKNYSLDEIVAKTHIRTYVIKAILEKRFEEIHSVKARGFITILEREFNVDLSDWLDEYANYIRTRQNNEGRGRVSYLVAPEPAKEEVRKKILLGLIGLVAFIAFFMILGREGEVTLPQESNESLALLTPFDQNSSSELNETNVTLTPVVINEANKSSQDSATPLEAQGITLIETNETAPATPKPGKILITTKSRLWFLVKPESGGSHQHIIKEYYELDDVDMTIVLGHGGVVLRSASGVLEVPDSNFWQIVVVKGGRFSLLKEKKVAPKDEVSDRQGELEVTTTDNP